MNEHEKHLLQLLFMRGARETKRINANTRAITGRNRRDRRERRYRLIVQWWQRLQEPKR